MIFKSESIVKESKVALKQWFVKWSEQNENGSQS
jgi:hypothetical protein